MVIEQPWNDDRLKINGRYFSAGSKEVADKLVAAVNASTILLPSLDFGLTSGAIEAPEYVLNDLQRGLAELRKTQ